MMKKLLISSLITFFYYTGFAQNGGFLDPSFGNGGQVVTSITPGEDEARTVAIQPDGKILVAGYSSSTVTGRDFACVRYMPNGDLDSTFGVNGIVTTDVQIGSQDVVNSMVLLSSGKFILAGYSDDGLDAEATMIRYNTDGSIDSTFGTNGIVLTDFFTNDFDQINVIKIHELTGNIVVGGHAYYEYTYFSYTANLLAPVIARYLPDGTPDSTFNGTGINLLFSETTGIGGRTYEIEDLAISPNGRITAVGWRQWVDYQYDDANYWMLRLNNNGTYDVTFGDNGETYFNGAFNQDDYARSIILNIDNTFVIGGNSYDSQTTEIDLVCFKMSADANSILWHGGGPVATDNSTETSYALLQDASNRYIMVGSVLKGNTASFALARVNSDGTDDSFGPGQNFSITTTFSQGQSQAFDGALQADGKIIAVGYAGNDFAIARYFGGDGPIQLTAPTITAPNNGAADYALAIDNFSWNAVNGATGYELAVSRNQSMSLPQLYTTNNTFYDVSLAAGTTYYWQVRANNGTDNGPWSAMRTYYEINLDSFALNGPFDQSIGENPNSVDLNWSYVTGSFPNVSYRILVDTVPSLNSPALLTLTTNANSYELSGLQPNTFYYWSVTSLRETEESNPSVVYSFKTDSTGTNIAELEINELTLYPNPANNKLTLNWGNKTLTGRVSVCNLLGKQFISQSFNNAPEMILDLNIPPGMYLVTISTENTTVTRKILKQ